MGLYVLLPLLLSLSLSVCVSRKSEQMETVPESVLKKRRTQEAIKTAQAEASVAAKKVSSSPYPFNENTRWEALLGLPIPMVLSCLIHAKPRRHMRGVPVSVCFLYLA